MQILQVLAHPIFQSQIAPRSRIGNEGGPLGAGLQEKASNHLKLLWSKAMVVSVKEKSRQRIVAGEDQGDSQNWNKGFAVPRLPEPAALSSRDNKTLHDSSLSRC